MPYSEGKLEVKGYKNGELAATDTRVTTGAPQRLKLSLDNDFTANGRDVALFTCECVDSEGRTVPNAAEFVEFSVANPATIIGTGSDNCDHKNVTNSSRKMYMGKIRIAVKVSKNQECVELNAFSENCGSASIKIEL